MTYLTFTAETSDDATVELATSEEDLAICELTRRYFTTTVDPNLAAPKNTTTIVTDCAAPVTGSPSTFGTGDLCYPSNPTCFKVVNEAATTYGYGALVQSDAVKPVNATGSYPVAGDITIPTELLFNGVPAGAAPFSYLAITGVSTDESTVTVMTDEASLAICAASFAYFTTMVDIDLESPKNSEPIVSMCASAMCSEIKAAYDDSSCCNTDLDQVSDYSVTALDTSSTGSTCRDLKNAYKGVECCTSTEKLTGYTVSPL
jgi:hypothetical protein